VILLGYDTPQGHLSETARIALDNPGRYNRRLAQMPARGCGRTSPTRRGSRTSRNIIGRRCFAVAVGNAPDHYRDDPKIAPNSGATACIPEGRTMKHSRCSTRWWRSGYEPLPRSAHRRPADRADRRSKRLQHGDAGWSLTELGTWERRDKTAARNTIRRLCNRPDGLGA